jgi:hypothetical protein
LEKHNTGEAADALTDLFQFNIPQRWSIAHLYQAILKGEEHVPSIDYMTTLEGYVHWMLTGERILGIGDCAGMFPIDGETKKYNKKIANINSEAGNRLMQYGWPGNTRELKNVVERLIVTNSSGVVDAQEAREAIGEMDLEEEAPVQASLINAAEFDVIRRVMIETGGNKSAAAKKLGISRPTLQRKLKMMEEAE